MIDMKKGFSLSAGTIFMLLLLLALVIYCFAYFMPAQNTLNMLKTETSLFNMEASIYEEYIADNSPLEKDIKSIQNEIDALHATGYINDSTVSFKISDAIQRYNIDLTSVTLEPATTFQNYRALPINLAVSGDFNDTMQFIQYFENDTEGSYLVRASSIEIAGNTTKAMLVIYLCTPNV